MPEKESILKAILDWISSSLRPSTVLFLLSLFLLSAPESWINRIKLKSIHDGFLPWIVLTFIFCGLWIGSFLAEAGTKKWLNSRKLNEKFQNLATDEKNVLKRFLDSNQGSVIMWPYEVGSLEEEGILIRMQRAPLDNGQYPFSFSSSALKYVIKNRTNLGEIIKS